MRASKMKRIHARQMLLAARTDTEASHEEGFWTTRCIHCRSRVGVGDAGEPVGSTTLEHIVPRAWFVKPRGSELIEGLDGPDDPRNLALACGRCNWTKGKRLDARGPGDARAVEVVSALLRRRRSRYREIDDA